MKKKLIAFSITAMILALGVTTYSYAQGTGNTVIPAATSYENQKPGDRYNSMIDLMKNNGFGEMAKAMENRDYDSMNNFMNNITQKDYESMINIMKGNGFDGMADAMKSVGRENMVKMHNAMGGARGMMFGNR